MHSRYFDRLDGDQDGYRSRVSAAAGKSRSIQPGVPATIEGDEDQGFPFGTPFGHRPQVLYGTLPDGSAFAEARASNKLGTKVLAAWARSSRLMAAC